MLKACLICGGGEASGEQLLETPCQRHWVCTDDVRSFFERATENESLYPPKCCDQIFLLDLYEEYVPFDVQWAYQMKEQGEYSVLAKYRVYCASASCSRFLAPFTHVKDPSSKTTYALCQEVGCGKLTCTSCKTLLNRVEGHKCEQDEDYKMFKQTVTEKGFQECPTCACTVELAEACNHITCDCGTEFCYICGKQWQGVHGCPHYGPAIYDTEGYNQEGYHRTTGLNREGLTNREQRHIDQADGDDDNEEDDQEDENEDDDDNDLDLPDWEVMQHVDPDVRATFAALPLEDREMFLVNLQIRLFEEHGITFPGPEEENHNDDGDAGDNDRDHNGDDSENNEEQYAAKGNDEAEGEEGNEHTGMDMDRPAAGGTGITSNEDIGDRAESGTGFDQHVLYLDEGNTGYADNGANEVGDEAAIRITDPAELADALQKL